MGLFALLGANPFFLSQSTKLAGALESDNTVLTAQKIIRKVNFTDNDLSDGYAYTQPLFTGSTPNYTLSSQAYIIADEDYAMLNNYSIDQALINQTASANVDAENILISFGNSGSSLYWLTVTAKLNNTVIDTSGTITETNVNNVLIKKFNQALDLKTLTNQEGQPFTSLQGYYEYDFSYRFIDSMGIVSEALTKSISFWLLDENDYVNVDANDIVPKLYNTEKINRENYISKVEQNFFNYNNFNLTDVYNPTLSSNLLLPTFVYDASRYNISYSRTLYGVTSYVTSRFRITNDQGEVSFYNEGEATPFKIDYVEKTTIGSKDYYFYDGLVLNNISDYNFTVSYTYQVNNDTFLVADTAAIYDANTRDNNIALHLFGYQMYYSKNNTGDAEFKYVDETTTIITDYTNNNQTFINDYDTDNWGYSLGEGSSLQISGTLASTNQAPVFLKSYSSLIYSSNFTTSRSYYYFYSSGSKTGTPQIIPYTNNTRFTQNGYYELVVVYDYQNYQYYNTKVQTGDKIVHMQVFAFKIANLPPTVNLKASKNSVLTTLTSGKYTNADYVSATWQASGVFDVAPTARLWRQNYDGYNPYTQPDLFNGSYDNILGTVYTEGSQIINSGHYTLQIYYGPSTSTSIIYKFTIDKNAISGFEVTGVSYGLDESDNVIYLKDDPLDLTGQTIISTPFTLDWNPKASGATISAKYSFTALSEKANFTPTLISQNGEEWITNGYETLTTFSNLTYYKTTTTGTDVLNSNSVLKTASIYLFTLTDLAGNTYTYYVILDNSDTKIIQTPEAVSKYNFVPTETTITWGTHKAIEISASSNLSSTITSNTTLFQTYNSQLYLIIPIEEVNIFKAGLDESDTLTNADNTDLSSIEAPNIRTYTKGVNFVSSVTFYTGLETSIPAGNEDLTGEAIYNTYVLDSSNLQDFTNLTYNNIVMLDLKMNLDRSQGYAETYGAVKDVLDNNYSLLQLNRGSNRQYLYFNFKNASDDYEIASLTYTFYPLTFDEASPNYPFSSTPSLTDMDILTGATLLEEDLYRTAQLNTIYSTKYSKDLTMPGMYVITRTYVGDINEQETGDTKVKQYVYYMDRYNIIEQLDTILIGENIKLLLGEVVGREAVVFDDFLINTTKETLLETNLLPIAIQIPQNKYSIYDELTGTYSDGIGSFDLEVTLLRKYRISGIQITESIATLNIVNGLIILPSLYKDGTYEVIIKDKTGSGATLIGSNQFSVSFVIQNNKPTGSFYGTPYSGQDIALLNVTSTNEENLKFMWTDPADIYTAKIDTGNITVTQQLKNSATKTVIYKVVDGVVTVNTHSLSLTQTAIGTLIGSNESVIRYKYGLQIFTSGSPLARIEATYAVTIQYEGLESHYVYDTSNFFNNTLSMTIDRTAPTYNLDRLITADTYLTATQKTIVKDNTSTINTENYAFAITSSFTFMRATGTYPSQDTYTIYYRKYNKYAAGEENLQSLIPGDENYDNYEVQPTRPRFNIANSAYIRSNYSIGTFLSQVPTAVDGDYYEIIEMDEAGNYTVYTVQTFFFGASLQGKMLLTIGEQEGEEEYENFIRNKENQAVIDALNLEVEQIVGTDLWYTLKIKNKGTNVTTTLSHTPDTVEATFISQINSLIVITPTIEITGASYEFTMVSRINKGFVFTYNTQGEVLEPTFIDYENSFVITLPAETAATKIESFKVYRSINGEFEVSQEYQVYYDMNGLAIDGTGASLASYEFEAGEYYFYFIDNFNRSYNVPKIFGLEDIAEVYYMGTTVTLNDVLYTANDVKIVYQTQLYSVTITKNGEEYVVPTAYITLNQQTCIEQLWLKNIAQEYGLVDNYVITITNTTGNSDYYPFTIYTEIPTVDLTDSLDNSLNYILGDSSTTKSVYVSYENTPILPYTASLVLEYLDDNGVLNTITYNNINPDFGYYLTGSYQLNFNNILGTHVEFNWMIRETETVIYSVIANVNGLDKILAPSTTKYSYNDTYIDQYFTKYEYNVDINPDRNLTLTTLSTTGTAATGIIKVYNLAGTQSDPYSKTFAVIKMPTSTNFLGTSLEVNDYYRSGSSYKTTTNPTTLSWANSYLFDGNYIYVDYYFNGNYVGKIYDSEAVLEDAGIYYFQFSDLSGNQQLFGTENYFTLKLINEVLFSINNLDPMNDMIYNDAVSLKIEQSSEYDYRSLSIAATLNGYEITPLKVNDAYIFSEYGLYNILLTAKVTLAGETESQTITTNYSFIILNENEAKLSFEYSPQTGYEILNVMKDGIDVTNTFKTLYNANTLTKLFLSPEEGGNGNYTVTVQANYLTLKPSQTFSFNVWINNESPMILSSVTAGSTTTKNIILSFNKYLIYQQVGDCIIKVNGINAIIINEQTSTINQVTNYELQANATYLVQLETVTGNTVLSFKVIKKAPLNTIAVFVIIVAIAIITTLTIVFIRLRTKMKVS